MAPELFIVGRVRKAHGLNGDVVVEPITDDPVDVFAEGRRLLVGTVEGDRDPRGRSIRVARAQPFKGGFLVHFDEIADRNEADLWRNRFLLLSAEEVPAAGDDEIYLHELPGMRVVLESGEPVGVVTDYYELPQGLTLDLQRNGRSVLIPYDRVVTKLDRAARTLSIDPPSGLLD
jgi:16S rRNA processing protein RimM